MSIKKGDKIEKEETGWNVNNDKATKSEIKNWIFQRAKLTRCIEAHKAQIKRYKQKQKIRPLWDREEIERTDFFLLISSHILNGPLILSVDYTELRFISFCLFFFFKFASTSTDFKASGLFGKLGECEVWVTSI